jgi:hypothetical protein
MSVGKLKSNGYLKALENNGVLLILYYYYAEEDLTGKIEKYSRIK